VSVLPKPTIGFKNFISEILSLGFNNAELDLMTKDNPRKLFYE
jgi:predicted metal-dependent phosphotriesterase family hydrolase